MYAIQLGLPAAFLFDVLTVRTDEWSFDASEPTPRPSTQGWSSGTAVLQREESCTQRCLPQCSSKHTAAQEAFGSGQPSVPVPTSLLSMADGHKVVMGVWGSRKMFNLIAFLPVRESDSKAACVDVDYTLLRDPPPLYLEKDPACLDAEYLISFFLYSYVTEVIMGMRN